MSAGKLFFIIIAVFLFPAAALAQETRFFVGLDVSGGKAFGSSSTTDGGAPFAGGGVVDNVEFGETISIGGHVGYRINPALSVSLGYQHIWGDVSWDANFPAIDAASGFEGTATSDTILAKVAYDVAISEAMAIRPNAGLGLTLNTLSDVVETDKPTGLFLSDVDGNTQVSPMAQIGVGIRYKLTSSTLLNIDTSVAYTGGFRTGNTRSGNLGITEIRPYEIEDVWRASLGASIQFEF